MTRRGAVAAGAALAVVLACVSLLPRRPTPLTCSSGAARVDVALPSGPASWCQRPARDGLPHREGPFVAWYPDGRRKIEGAYRDGVADGAWTYWSPDGRKREAGQYRNGREEGPWVRWHTTGALAEAGVYRDGRREGRWTFWFANGEKARAAEYQADASVGIWRRWNLRGDPCPAPVDT